MKTIKEFFTQEDKLYHIIAGLIFAAIFAIVLPIPIPIVPVIFAAFIKEFVYQWRGGKFDWQDFTATLIGGVIIQIMVMI